MRPEDARVLYKEVMKSRRIWNEFEAGFLKTVDYRVKQGVGLTERQARVLQGIYRKSQGG